MSSLFLYKKHFSLFVGKILIWKTRYTFFRGYKNGSNKDRKVYRYSTERKRIDARATWRKAWRDKS